MEAIGPKLSPLGRALPRAVQELLRDWAPGLDLAGLLADLFLEYPKDDSGFDPVATKRWYFAIAQTVCRYFRLQVIDAASIPPGPSLIVGCHSGVMAWDATCLVAAIYDRTGRFSRNTGHRFFASFAPMERFLTARGVVIGSQENLEACLRHGEMVLLFPGGAEDMRRPFLTERYVVKPHRGFAPGHGGYVKLALRTQVPIVPTAIVGAEETHLLLTDVPALARLLHVPFFPIVASPLPLPARMYIRFGRPIHLDHPPSAAHDQGLVDRLNGQVRGELQGLIDDTLRRRRGVFLSSYDGATAREIANHGRPAPPP